MTAEGQPAPHPRDRAGGEAGSGSRDELETIRLRHELAVDAAGIGSFDWDLATNRLVWDERMSALMVSGVPAEPAVQDFVDHILPADREAVGRATQQAIREGGDLRVDFRIIDDGGATRWLTVRGRVLCGADGRAARMMGAVYDSSGVHLDRERAAQALDSMATAYATIDTTWRVSYANEAARRLLSGRGEPVGQTVHELLPALADPSIDALLDQVMSDRQPARYEIFAPRLDRWLEVSAQPVTTGIAVLVADVTARRAAQEEALQAAHRVELLARAGTELVQRRPVSETVEAGLALLVPELADSAMIYLRESPGQPLRLVGLRNPDPQAEADLRALFRALPLGDDPGTATGRAVATGHTQVIGDLGEAIIGRATSDPQLRARLLAIKAKGVLAIPLVSRGESIGFLGLLGRGGEAATGPDLVLIEDIASRIASALDNAQILTQVQQASQDAASVSGRLEFLASVADALGSTLDAEQAAARLARMLVPHLADWALVTLLDDDGGVDHIVSHADPARRALVERYARGRHESLKASPGLLAEVVTEGGQLTQFDGGQFLERMSADPAGAALRELRPGWVTALPILARDRTLGVISLFFSAERAGPDDNLLEAASEVARRAGLVFDNARLYRRSQSMAVTLQRSLLTPAVQPADLEVRPHYVPAIADAQVGGDWYDAFQTPDGTTTLVIGDVMGHDSGAAALMGQLRTLVRAIAVDRQESPSAVLSRVDSAAMALGLDTTATAVVAQVLPADVAGERRFRWSNAGHPPPIVLLPGGEVRVLDSPSDLLLGLGDESPRTDHVTTLPAGATVLMFTDGLVEGRQQPFEDGMKRLRAAVSPLRGQRLEDSVRRAPGRDAPAGWRRG